MKFDITHKILAGIVVVCLAGLGVGFSSWLGAHDAALQLNATLAAHKQADEAIAKAEAARDAQTASTLADLAKAGAAIKTPQQAAIAIPRELNQSLPQPIAISPQTLPFIVNCTDTPDKCTSTGTIQNTYRADIPIEDLKPLNDKIIEYEQCRVALPTCQADLTDQKRVNDSLEMDLKQAQKVANGKQPFWASLKSHSKWFVIGGVAATAAVCAVGHCR